MAVAIESGARHNMSRLDLEKMNEALVDFQESEPALRSAAREAINVYITAMENAMNTAGACESKARLVIQNMSDLRDDLMNGAADESIDAIQLMEDGIEDYSPEADDADFYYDGRE